MKRIKIINTLKFFISKIFRLRNFFKYKTKFGNVFLDESNTGISKVIAIYGSREDDKQYLLKESIENKTIYLDLGSNIGVYPFLVSGLLDSKSFLICIEPDIRNHKTLLKNFKNCDTQKIFLPYAISNKDQKSKFILSKYTNLNYLVDDQSIVNENSEFIEIETISFNTLVRKFIPKYYLNNEYKLLIRMDIEGGERDVLKSIDQFLADNKPLFRSISIIYENHPPNIQQLDNYGTTLKNLIKKGFKINKIISAGGLRIEDIKLLINKSSSYKYIYSDTFRRIEIIKPNQKEAIRAIVSRNKLIRYCDLELKYKN